MEIHINSEAELPRAAREFLEWLGDRKIVAFDAPMGAGKTTFISEVCRQLGVQDDISSPTFAIVNEYDGTADRIYHFDLYRLDDIEEVRDMGFEDYIDSGSLCLLEWPDIAAHLLPADAATVSIRVNDDNSRTLTCR